MNDVTLICNKCKNDMTFVSSSGTSRNHAKREIWDCTRCGMEVLVVYGD
jgi:hypothetical protein